MKWATKRCIMYPWSKYAIGIVSLSFVRLIELQPVRFVHFQLPRSRAVVFDRLVSPETRDLKCSVAGTMMQSGKGRSLMVAHHVTSTVWGRSNIYPLSRCWSQLFPKNAANSTRILVFFVLRRKSYVIRCSCDYCATDSKYVFRLALVQAAEVYGKRCLSRAVIYRKMGNFFAHRVVFIFTKAWFRRPLGDLQLAYFR